MSRCAPWRAITKALVERFERRAGSDERHPGHHEHASLDEVRAALMIPDDAPLSLPGALLAMETTHFAAIDCAMAVGFARMALDGAMDAG